jgi:F-type H+-transporting ATPase subunit epsilon
MAQAQASNEKIEFELVSPEAKLVAEPVTMAVIPGMDGEMGVGVDHSSFVVGLKPGVVKLYKASRSEEPQRIFIAGGFADVTAKSCIVLAEEAVNVNELDAAKLGQELGNLSEDIAQAKDETEKSRAQNKIVVVKAKLFAVTGESQYL